MQKFTLFKTFKEQIKLINKLKLYSIYFIYFFEFICGGITPILGIYTLRLIIDCFSETTTINDILPTILIICGIGAVCQVISSICRAFGNAKFLIIRMEEYKSLVRRYRKIDYYNFEDSSFQDEMMKSTRTLNGDNDGFQKLYVNILELLPNIFTTGAIVGILAYINPIILIFVTLSLIVGIMVNGVMEKRISQKEEKINEEYKKMSYFKNVFFDFNYGKDIRIYQMNKQLKKHYDYHINTYVDVLKNLFLGCFKIGLIELVFLFLQDGFSYYFVVMHFIKGNFTIGQLSFYIGLIATISTTLRTITSNLVNTTWKLRETQEYYEFINRDGLYFECGNHQALEKNIPLEIEFVDVSFKYPNTERYIIKDFNFKIEAGQKLAIVGDNGAGKSTIIKLICGLFRPTKGKILVNGIDINDYDTTEYRKMIACVFQEVNLYPFTVLENVIGDDIEEDCIKRGIECVEKVGLKEKIESLPKKYNQPVLKILEEDGIDFSGGEAQKLAIARALYKDANLVILDEPTSALDALAEATIYQSFANLVENKTAIYISHRLSSTKFCDKIALFTKDGLVEYGTHDELIDKKGLYYHIFTVQGKYYQEGSEYHD